MGLKSSSAGNMLQNSLKVHSIECKVRNKLPAMIIAKY